MLTNTSLTRRVLGGVVGVNLTLALAVSAGAVPRPGDNVQTAAATQVEELAAPAARQAGDVAAQAVQATPPPAQAATPTTAAPATTVAKPKVTTPPTTKAPKVAAAPKATSAPAVTAPPAAPAPAAVVATVARRVPTAAEVQGVVTRLKADIPILKYVSISPAQIDQAGDQVCDAFDAGQTFAQVKATGLSLIPASIKVPAATADYAVRQAVAMYCPGHANKLV
jgi:hypothetical protein